MMKFSSETSISACDNIQEMEDDYDEDEETEEVEDIPDSQEEEPQAKKHVEAKPSDFYFGRTLGEGAFARVVHAKMKNIPEQDFAIKIMEKAHIKKEDKVKYVMMERDILSHVDHPLIIKFYFSFQDAGYLYMCMDLAPGGELLRLINMKHDEKLDAGIDDEACSEELTRFYISEIIVGLEYLHSNGIIHRDLKPENILLSSQGHIRITDFGTSLKLNDDKSLRNSFVGTSDYVSPEVLSNKEATKACDLWAVGCMIYQMMTGRSPFRSETEYLTFECILCHCNGSCPLQYPPVMYNTAAIELTKSLLQNEEINRLGAGAEGTDNGYAQLKAHKFFSEIVWDSILSMDPPYTPDTTKFPNKDISSMYDGASDEWLFDGDPTPIQEKPLRQSHGISIDDDDEDIRLLSQSTKQQQARQKYSKFLRADEEQVFTGLIYKRKGLFSKKRQLILTNSPRLVYFDPDTMELKGEIPWTDEEPVSCHMKNDREFDVKCNVSGRVYHLTDIEADAKTWIDYINSMLEMQLARTRRSMSPVNV